MLKKRVQVRYLHRKYLQTNTVMFRIMDLLFDSRTPTSYLKFQKNTSTQIHRQKLFCCVRNFYLIFKTAQFRNRLLHNFLPYLQLMISFRKILCPPRAMARAMIFFIRIISPSPSPSQRATGSADKGWGYGH